MARWVPDPRGRLPPSVCPTEEEQQQSTQQRPQGLEGGGGGGRGLRDGEHSEQPRSHRQCGAGGSGGQGWLGVFAPVPPADPSPALPPPHQWAAKGNLAGSVGSRALPRHAPTHRYMQEDSCVSLEPERLLDQNPSPPAPGPGTSSPQNCEQ